MMDAVPDEPDRFIRAPDLYAVLAAGEAAVRNDRTAFEAALAAATAALDRAWPPESGDRSEAIAGLVDRLAYAAIEGEILAGQGDILARALAAGRFDAFLRPDSRAELWLLAQGRWQPASPQDQPSSE